MSRPRAPKNTPAAIVALFNAAANACLADRELVARLARLGDEPVATAAEFGKFIVSETGRSTKVIGAARVALE